MQRDLALVRTMAMLEEIDALPGAERHAAGTHRDGQLHSGQRGPQVCRQKSVRSPVVTAWLSSQARTSPVISIRPLPRVRNRSVAATLRMVHLP